MPDHIQLYQPGSTMSGRIIFALTLVAALGFFWWLLIYDHGVVAVQ